MSPKKEDRLDRLERIVTEFIEESQVAAKKCSFSQQQYCIFLQIKTITTPRTQCQPHLAVTDLTYATIRPSSYRRGSLLFLYTESNLSERMPNKARATLRGESSILTSFSGRPRLRLGLDLACCSLGCCLAGLVTGHFLSVYDPVLLQLHDKFGLGSGSLLAVASVAQQFQIIAMVGAAL